MRNLIKYTIRGNFIYPISPAKACNFLIINCVKNTEIEWSTQNNSVRKLEYYDSLCYRNMSKNYHILWRYIRDYIVIYVIRPNTISIELNCDNVIIEFPNGIRIRTFKNANYEIFSLPNPLREYKYIRGLLWNLGCDDRRGIMKNLLIIRYIYIEYTEFDTKMRDFISKNHDIEN
jgi:hypothetical protein